MLIRTEKKEDYNKTYDFIFEETKDIDKALFIEKLRANPNFDEKMSAVCEKDNLIRAHALMVPVYSEYNKLKGLFLSNIVVAKDVSGYGIGAKLVEYLIKIATKLGYQYVLVVGNNQYYSKMGFKVCEPSVKPPFLGVPENSFLYYEIVSNSLHNALGDIVYPKEYVDIRQ